jgi:S1-C subfamily serine protease
LKKFLKFLEYFLRILLIVGFLLIYSSHYIDNKGIKNRLSFIEHLQEYSLNYQRDLYKQIANAIIREKEVEYNILRYTVFIENDSDMVTGSGITIKYKNNFYILSAGHLISTLQDKVFLSENGERICELEIIKVDHKLDLLLMRPKDSDIIPLVYSTLALEEYPKSEKVFVCGNPAGIEDILSEGRIVEYKGHVMYIQDSCWFGSSGGGVFNQQGELIGIISFLSIVDSNPFGMNKNVQPLFVIDGIVRLEAIYSFLEGA